MTAGDTHNEQLISAYLDGELTSDERQHVERLLAERAEYRQLLGDLRSLMGEFQQLPRLSLDEGFVSRVIQQTRSAVQMPSDAQPSTDVSLELLSAFVDGELSEGEATRVQHELDADESSRNYVQQVRALDDDLKAFPKVALGDDFADRVLRSAERTMLAPAEVEPPDSADIEAQVALASSTATDKSHLSWRGFVWSAAAITAALLLAIQFGRDTASNVPNLVSNPADQPGPAVVAQQNGNPPGTSPLESPEPNDPIEPPRARTPAGAWPVVLAMQENARQRFILVYEVSVTSLGAEQGVFAKLLNRHKIGFRDTVAVGEEDESALLKRRYLKGVKAAPAADKEMDEIHLYLVSCSGSQADALYQDLAGGPPGFASFSLNLTSGAAGGGVLNRVCEASHISERSSEAVRLLTRFAMISETARNLGVFGTIEWVDPELLQPSPQSGANKPDRPKAEEPRAEHGEFQCELLFVVRNLRADGKPPATEEGTPKTDAE